MKVPCKECICIPVCRHKKPGVVLEQCSLINNYVANCYPVSKFDISIAAEHRRKLTDVLKPTQWNITDSGYIHYKSSWR